MKKFYKHETLVVPATNSGFRAVEHVQPSLLLDLIAWTLSALSAADSDLWLLLHYWILLWAIISPVKFWATFIISSTLWLLQWQKGEQNGCDVSMFAQPLRLKIRTRNNKRSVNFPRECCIEKKI